MKRSWLINGEHIRHIINRRCGGKVSAFVERTGIDKNTARRWFNTERATTYGSTVSNLSKTFGMPVAAFAYRHGQAAGKPPSWLAPALDLLGDGAAFITHGPVLPYSAERPFVRSWRYTPPRECSWGLLRVQYSTPTIKLQVVIMKRVQNLELWFLLGEVRCNEGAYIEESGGHRRRFSAANASQPRTFTLALPYDSWPSGFLVRCDTAVEISEIDQVCQHELEHIPQDGRVTLAQVFPLTTQRTPSNSIGSCRYCIQHGRSGPPVSGVVRRDGTAVHKHIDATGGG